jgi:hypothetical protein
VRARRRPTWRRGTPRGGRAGGRLEVGELEVGEVAGELVEAGLVVAVAGVGEALALGAQVDGGLLAEREQLVALVAREAREAAGLIRSPIAGKANVDTSVIANFEMGRSSPRELDRVLDAYVEECGLESYRELLDSGASGCPRSARRLRTLRRPIREAAEGEPANGDGSPPSSARKQRFQVELSGRRAEASLSAAKTIARASISSDVIAPPSSGLEPAMSSYRQSNVDMFFHDGASKSHELFLHLAKKALCHSG